MEKPPKMTMNIYDELAKTPNVRLGQIKLYREESYIGGAVFTVHETQINVDDLEVRKRYRMKGFGRLLMNVIMALAEELKKPLFLYATEKSVEFYERIGMLRVLYWKTWGNGVTVEFMNFNPEKTLREQCSDIDFVWIPARVQHIRIYL